MAYELCLLLIRDILVTPRSEEEGGTGPDTVYWDLANEVQRSNT